MAADIVEIGLCLASFSVLFPPDLAPMKYSYWIRTDNGKVAPQVGAAKRIPRYRSDGLGQLPFT